jgi:hypothetical protein
MKTGSLVNMLMDGATPSAPTVGMGCTILGWTDRHAGTVVSVTHGGKRLGVQRDRAIRTDDNGMSDAQSYRYEPQPEAPVHYYSLRKDGKYREVGAGQGGLALLLGVRREYYDFSF